MDGSPLHVLGRLADLSGRQGLEALRDRLSALEALVRGDLRELDAALMALVGCEGPVGHSVRHLLGRAGKRLRPICVLLAARLGRGVDERTRQLAVAVELVHAATLLHDDVVDGGEQRRGVPSARVLWGNAASIFAGDWLLVEALRRVRATGLDDLLDALLAVVDEMIQAEALQLAHRGDLEPDLERWLRVAEGKTASLFRWAVRAGGRAGGLDPLALGALDAYGRHLGVAFQIVDDVLDLAAHQAPTGKSALSDLREGKINFPVALAMRRNPEVRSILGRWVESTAGRDALDEDPRELLEAVIETGSVRDSLAEARRRVDGALEALEALRPGPARDALCTAAHAALARCA
ncbi:MAG: polyprenyl synthetase family protein [Myxococcota bacterium]|nr:polyprenyl synthetase family protein [Myxococcota bacterium]MDW8363604.1 polyprenyl synthetase family protein [Myxococcales bacterium]